MMRMHLLTNPLTRPMFWPLVILLLAIFTGAGLILLMFQTKRAIAMKSSTSSRVLWQRYRSWCIIALLFVGAALSGPLAIAALCAFVCWQGGKEYARLTDIPGSHSLALILGGWITFVAALVFGSVVLVVAPVLAFFSWSALALRPVAGEKELSKRFNSGIAGLWGYLYLGWLPAYLLALSASKAPGMVLVVGTGVALSDVGAFCMGKVIGGPKLAPHLSPGKTWGGVLGNILGAALALALMTFALPDLTLWQRGLFALAIGLGSVWGDLLESLLKRQCGVKDAGGMLPGFGGLLDRIDSLLIATPLVYFLALLLIG